MPHKNTPAGRNRPDAVRNDPVLREVAAADDISRSGRRNRDALRVEKRFPVAVRHQLRAGFAVGIRVVAVQRLVLPIAPDPLAVLIDLVRRHVEEGADRVGPPDAFTDVHRPHDVCLIGEPRLPVGGPHDRLRGQMEDDIRLREIKGGLKRVWVPHVSPDGADPVPHAGKRVEIRIRRRIQRISGHIRPGLRENFHKPAPLEAGMACHQDAFSAIQISFSHSVPFCDP